MTTIAVQAQKVSFLWLELTGRCGLSIDRTNGRHADVLVVRVGV